MKMWAVSHVKKMHLAKRIRNILFLTDVECKVLVDRMCVHVHKKNTNHKYLLLCKRILGSGKLCH